MQAVNVMNVAKIVNNRNYAEALDTEIEISEPLSAEGLSISVLPVDISAFRQIRYVKVEPGTSIPEHAHEEAVFRFITQGSAVVNGETYSEGDWMIIPAKTKYKVNTETGYSAFWICLICKIR